MAHVRVQQTTVLHRNMTDALDKIIDAHASTSASAGPSRKPRGDVTYDDFQKMLDSTPLFMRETPDSTNDDPVLEALRTLVFEGDGDGQSLSLAPAYPLSPNTLPDGLTVRGRDQLQESRE
jgi:hypothetical protein